MFSFDKKMTQYMKGVAILFMLALHTFEDNAWFNVYLAEFSSTFKICVAMYAFLTGFAYSFAKKQDYKYSFTRMRVLLERYWLQFTLIYIPLMIVLGEYVITPYNVLINLFGLEGKVNWYSWYVYFYIFTMLVFPLYIKICKKNFIFEALATIVICYIIEVGVHCIPGWDTNRFTLALFSCFAYFPCAAVGYLIAKHKIFEVAQNKLTKNVFVWLLVAIVVLFARNFKSEILGFKLDVLYAPVLIYALFIVFANIREKLNDKCLIPLGFIGKYSTELWFLHAAIFMYPEMSKLLYISRSPMVVYCWLLIMCLPIAVILHWIAGRIDMIIDRKLGEGIAR